MESFQADLKILLKNIQMCSDILSILIVIQGPCNHCLQTCNFYCVMQRVSSVSVGHESTCLYYAFMFRCLCRGFLFRMHFCQSLQMCLCLVFTCSLDVFIFLLCTLLKHLSPPYCLHFSSLCNPASWLQHWRAWRSCNQMQMMPGSLQILQLELLIWREHCMTSSRRRAKGTLKRCCS